VENRVKKELFSVAAEIQKTLGRKVSLNEAIEHLIKYYRAGNRDIASMLSLFGSLGPRSEARLVLRELRRAEGKYLERTVRKHRA